MKFGTIGAGMVALAFARPALAQGHEVVLGSRRGPDSLAGEVAELDAAHPSLRSRKLRASSMCCSRFPGGMSRRHYTDCPPGMVGYSSMRQIRSLRRVRSSFWQTWAARGPARWWLSSHRAARVVKAFNSIVTARFNEGPMKNGGRRVIFVSGDHSEPKGFIKELIKSFGFEPIDLGGLVTGGRLQQAGGPLAGLDLTVFGGL